MVCFARQSILTMPPPTHPGKLTVQGNLKKNPRGGMVRNCNKGGGKCIGNLGREGKGSNSKELHFMYRGSGNCDSHQLYLRVGDRLNFIIYSSALMFM